MSMEGEIIAPAPSVWTIMMEHAVDLQKDLITLLETKKNVLLVTFSSGLVLGTVLGCLCGCCTRRGTKSAKDWSMNVTSYACGVFDMLYFSSKLLKRDSSTPL
ncbi:unnamed protein product [Peronospora belbahrii]|uniref:Uncharacterized protein n=1 Tax=Peronospora belbahrii TaxID=622444 RepID=A0ABN8CV84_9STRA|nr:unnamed protein product [Peronospora belbahrii]